MPGLADAHDHVVAVLHSDHLVVHVEEAVAVRGQVAGRVLRVEPFEVEVLGVRSRVGESPCNAPVVPEHHDRHSGEGGSHDVASRPREVGEVPDRGNGEAKMRVVGEKRLAGLASLAVHHPTVGAGVAAPVTERNLGRLGPAGRAVRARRVGVDGQLGVRGDRPVEPAVRRNRFAIGARTGIDDRAGRVLRQLERRSSGRPACLRLPAAGLGCRRQRFALRCRGAFRVRQRLEARIRSGATLHRLAGRGRRRLGKQDAPRPILPVGGVEIENPVRREEVRHPKPHQVARPLAAEVEGHHLGPHHGIGRRPGLGLEAENQELGRERPDPRVEPGIDPVDVGVEPAPRARCEVREGGRRAPMEAEHPEQPVGSEGGCAQHLRESPGPDPAVHLHLPQPVLRVDVAEGEEGVVLAPGEDVRDAVPVAHHLHRGGETVRGALAVDRRERPAQPQVPARGSRGGEDHDGEQRPAQPLQSLAHAASPVTGARVRRTWPRASNVLGPKVNSIEPHRRPFG